MELANGTYRARAQGAQLSFTSAGAEQVAIGFELLDGAGGIAYYGYFTEKATPITLRALRTAGWTGNDLSDLSSIGAEGTPEVSLVIENETYQGKTRPKVKWVNTPDGGVAVKNPLPADKAKAFAARMKGAILAFDKSADAPKPRPAVLSPEPPPNLDEPPDLDNPPF